MRTHHPTYDPAYYDPAYSVATEMSARVIAYADEHGIIAAAKHFNLAQSTIYRWLADARVTSGGNTHEA